MRIENSGQPKVCSRCGQVDGWRPLVRSNDQQPIWIRNLVARIEGNNGQVLWR